VQLKWVHGPIKILLPTILLCFSDSAIADHERQPDNEKSLILSQDRDVTDSEFATLIKDNLPNKNIQNVQSIIAVIHSCYSGGFIDELIALGGRVSIATTCKHNEIAANDFAVKWIEALLDRSNQFVEARKTFDEGKRRMEFAPPKGQGAPQYHSTDREADRTVFGIGFFRDPQGDLVRARSRKALFWVGQEVADKKKVEQFKLWSNWTRLKAVREITNIPPRPGPETLIYYDSLDAGLWRYNEANMSHEQLTEEQFNGLTDAGKKEVVRVDGQGTKANLVNAIERFAQGMDNESQLFIFLASHGDRKARPADNPGDPAILPGTSFEDIFIIDASFVGSANSPLLSIDTSNITLSDNQVFLNDAFLGNLTPTEISDRTELPIVIPLVVGANTLRIQCNQTEPCQVDNIGLLPTAGVCPSSDFGDAPDSYRTTLVQDGPRYRAGVFQ
jgi:hypothetical protein